MKRIFNSLLAAWFMLYASGFPIPAIALSTIPNKETKERFPCESCPCGCSTAAYCWTKCCCHTLAERIAWAKRNDVKPPEHVIKQAAEEGIDVSVWAVFPANSLSISVGITAKPSSNSCTKCCCSNKQPNQCQQTSESPVESSIKFPKGISIWQSLVCQGLMKQWLTGSCGPLPEFVDWSPCNKWQIVAESSRPSHHFYGEPPQPPPPRHQA